MEPTFDYIEEDCCGNCEHYRNYHDTYWCTNKIQLSLADKPENPGLNINNILYVKPFGKCMLHRRKVK